MSLKDQMLKAGLINNKQANKASTKKKKSRTMAKEVKASVEAQRQEQVERDKAKNQALLDAQREREIRAQIKQLISTNNVEHKGDIKYNFTFDNKIKSLYVNETIRKELLNGLAVIAVFEDEFTIIPGVVGDKIAQRDPSVIIENEHKEAPPADEDDPYKDFVVPDDLMW